MASSMEDDESYWDSSKASNLKTYGMNLFDERAGDFKEIYKDLNRLDPSDEDEEDDVINWDGTSSNTGQSQKGAFPKTTSTDGLSVRYQRSQGGSTSARSAVSTSKSNTSLSSGGSTKHQVTPISSVPRSNSSSISIAEAVGAHVPGPNKTDAAKLEAEVNFLKRKVDEAKQERWATIKPKETVLQIIYGKNYSLENYKSKEHKLELLDEAIAHHDGNAIMATVLFLRDTVKSAIFNLELTKRPIAMNHYVSYLKMAKETALLMDVLGMLGRNEEAAMIKYKQVCSVKDPEEKRTVLESCKTAHFDSEFSLSQESALVQEQIDTLSRQIPVEKADHDREMAGDPIFKQLPRAASIVNQPVITWLFYCCFYHYQLSENNFASPLAIKKANQLTDKQFLWAAVSARAKLKIWRDIDTLFQTKTWFKGVQLRCPMGFHRLLHVLNHYNAPRDVMNKYCRLIEDVELRLRTGEKFNCYEAVIDALVSMRDRKQLVQYQAKFKSNTQEWFYAADILRNTSIKWKN